MIDVGLTGRNSRGPREPAQLSSNRSRQISKTMDTTRCRHTLLPRSMRARLWFVVIAMISLSCTNSMPADSQKEASMVEELDMTNPRNSSRWEASPDNIFKSKLTIVKLTAIRGSLTKAGHQTARSVALEVCGALPRGLTAEQRQAIDFLKQNEATIFPKVRAAIYDFYGQSYKDYKKGWTLGAKLFGGGDISDILPEVVAGNELDRLVKFERIFIHSPRRGGVSIGIECSCTWDEEHGLGVMISADGTAKAGLAELAYPSN